MRATLFTAMGAALALLLAGPAARAQDAAVKIAPPQGRAVVVTPVLSASTTISGQPIILPQGDIEVVVSTYDIAAGATLPEHKHIFPRYAYVLTGTLDVTNTETGKSQVYAKGDFILEAIAQWHRAAVVGGEPVKLLVIDQIEKGTNNVVLKK